MAKPWDDLHDTQLRRGDIVVLSQGGDVIVKRVAYIPGDTFVESCDDNGACVLDDVPDSVERDAVMKRLHVARFEQTVKAGMVFVLGDCPEQSSDSRSFGPISTSTILMRVADPSPAPQCVKDDIKAATR